MNNNTEKQKLDIAVLRYSAKESLPGMRYMNRTKWKISTLETLRKLSDTVACDGIIVAEVEEGDIAFIKEAVEANDTCVSEVGTYLVAPALFWVVFSKVKIKDLQRINLEARSKGINHAFASFFKERIEVDHIPKLDPSSLKGVQHLTYRIYGSIKRADVLVGEFMSSSDEMSLLTSEYNKQFNRSCKLEKF